jgi:uncharacterized coiled-coil protein SlyX
MIPLPPQIALPLEAVLKYKTIIIYSALAIFVLSIIGLIVYQRHEIKVLGENNAKLEMAVETQDKTIEQMNKDFAQIQQTKDEYAKAVSDLAKERTNLLNSLYREQRGKLSLEQLIAKDKRNRVQTTINNATKKVLRCIEIESGAPLNKNEKIDCSK